MDSQKYTKRLEEQVVEHESLCKRCGECCGLGNDPCANLISDEQGKYSCRVYDSRLGFQKTVSGKIFNCVPITENIRSGFQNPKCAYMESMDGV